MIRKHGGLIGCFLVASTLGGVRADDLEGGQAVRLLESAISARGGAKCLDKLSAYCLETKGIFKKPDGSESDYESTTWVKSPQ